MGKDLGAKPQKAPTSGGAGIGSTMNRMIGIPNPVPQGRTAPNINSFMYDMIGAKPPSQTTGLRPQPFSPSVGQAAPQAPQTPQASPQAPYARPQDPYQLPASIAFGQPNAKPGQSYEQAASQRNIMNANRNYDPSAPFPTFRPAGAEIAAWLAKNGFATPSKD